MKVEVIIKPNAKEQKVEQLTDKAFKVSVKSPPSEGKANRELIEVLADFFGVHKNEIKIVFGWKSRMKVVEIKNL